MLDIGGKKHSNRGKFRLSEYRRNILYLNLDPITNPDLLCDAHSLPIKTNCIEEIICAETLEHVRDPKKVLEEILRVLKPGGHCYLTIPFLFRIHADPQDFNRFTYFWIHENLKDLDGLFDYEVIQHGSYRSVILEMFRHKVFLKRYNRINIFLVLLYELVKKWAIYMDEKDEDKNFTLGYAIKIYKNSQLAVSKQIT